MQVQSAEQAAATKIASVPMRKHRFPLGMAVLTPGVQSLVAQGRINPVELLERHATGNWGDVCDEDKATNDRALRVGARLMSVYKVDTATAVWVITECDRSVTTLLLPSEY